MDIFPFFMGFLFVLLFCEGYHVFPAGLSFLSSSDPLASASQAVEIASVSAYLGSLLSSVLVCLLACLRQHLV